MPLGREAADEVVGHVEGVDFAVHLLLAHAAGDELGDLGAEIEDQDFLVHSGFHRVKTLIANYSP